MMVDKSFLGKIVASGRCGQDRRQRYQNGTTFYYESLKCELMQINAEIMLVTLE